MELGLPVNLNPSLSEQAAGKVVRTEETVIVKDEGLANIKNTDELRKAKISGQEVSISEEQLIKAIERAVKAIQGPDTRLDFSIHDQTKRIMVKVINKDSGEIIREIPPEKSMDLLVNLWEMAGILVDERR